MDAAAAALEARDAELQAEVGRLQAQLATARSTLARREEELDRAKREVKMGLSLGRHAPRPVAEGGPTEEVPLPVFGEPIYKRKQRQRARAETEALKKRYADWLAGK